MRFPIVAVALLAALALPHTAAAEDNGDCFGDAKRIAECDPNDRQAAKPKPESTLSDEELAKLPRDERRTKYLEGFTCNTMIRGQSGYVKYLPGGQLRVGHQEGDVAINWKIENDQLCLYGNRVRDNCYDLPKQDLRNGKASFLRLFEKSCL